MEEERIGRVSKQQFDSLIQCEIQFDPVKRERAGGGGGSKETLHKAKQKEKRMEGVQTAATTFSARFV